MRSCERIEVLHLLKPWREAVSEALPMVVPENEKLRVKSVAQFTRSPVETTFHGPREHRLPGCKSFNNFPMCFCYNLVAQNS